MNIATIMAVYSLGLLCNGFAGGFATRWVMGHRAWHGGLIGRALVMVSCAVRALAHSLPMVVLGFAIAGVAMAFTQYDYAWMLVRLYHPHCPRRVVTAITLYGALASSIMWPIAQWLLNAVGPT